jgi:glycosyltransferase involved in cell wall biosynthesis
VLEGFAAGVPVLTSDASSLPEVAGDAAVRVGTDEEAIADGLARLWDDEALRARLVAAGRERLGVFTWAACARGTARVLHRAAEHAR